VLAAVFLLAALPLALPIALLVLLTSGRPVFYRGDRVGRGGRVFTMLKFRTLRSDAESRLGPYLGEELVRRTEDEFTPIGRWLKGTQLDEIPQFLNVLRGDMSLVGPRPIRPVFFEELARELPAYWQRLVVRPGLTGLAQVRRGYETSMAEKLAHDLEWIADRSARLYLRTVLATGMRVLGQSLRGLVSSRP
jgi:lipopolysaccharide/colanic/teichoic acid biosynthesis glycosyltransferase